jgi:hypothetical protein
MAANCAWSSNNWINSGDFFAAEATSAIYLITKHDNIDQVSRLHQLNWSTNRLPEQTIDWTPDWQKVTCPTDRMTWPKDYRPIQAKTHRTRFDNAPRFFYFHWPDNFDPTLWGRFRSALIFWVIWSTYIKKISFQKLKNRAALSNRVRCVSALPV